MSPATVKGGCRNTRENSIIGRVVELVYTRHLKCLGASHAGSTPVSPTIFCCESTSTPIADTNAVAEGRNVLILLLMFELAPENWTGR